MALHQILQNAQTTGNGTSKAFTAGIPRELKFYIFGTGTIAGGAVQVEEAHDPNYAGTWAAIGSPVTVAQDTIKTVATTGAFGAVRARISTAITGGGTVTVHLFATQNTLA